MGENLRPPARETLVGGNDKILPAATCASLNGPTASNVSLKSWVRRYGDNRAARDEPGEIGLKLETWDIFQGDGGGPTQRLFLFECWDEGRASLRQTP